MMPRVIGNDSLIARVNEVQGCMYRQSNELGRLNKAVRRYKAENAKLRELVADMLNAWDDVQRETVTGPTFDECEARACKMGIEL